MYQKDSQRFCKNELEFSTMILWPYRAYMFTVHVHVHHNPMEIQFAFLGRSAFNNVISCKAVDELSFYNHIYQSIILLYAYTARRIQNRRRKERRKRKRRMRILPLLFLFLLPFLLLFLLHVCPLLFLLLLLSSSSILYFYFLLNSMGLPLSPFSASLSES